MADEIGTTAVPEQQEKLWNSEYLKVWSSNFLLFFAFMLMTPLLPLYLTDTYHADKEVIGFVLAGYALAALLVRPFSGYIVDTWPRKTVLLITYFLTCAFFGGYLIAGSLTMFAIFRMLHGGPFGATGVSLSTVMIDVLPSSRRAEGIGYFGLSNNVATALAPSIGMLLFSKFHSYDMLFTLSLLCSLIGVLVDSTLKLKPREIVRGKQAISLDRFLLLKGWAMFLVVFALAFAYSVVTTYVAIYGREKLGITTGTGLFFALFAIGLIISRLTGSKSLREGKVVRNASMGILVSISGFVLFSSVHNEFGYYLAPFIIGLGNGHLWPACQTMFINLAEHTQRGTANSTILTAWDLGMGVGMFVGGSVAEHFGYFAAFWTGIIFYTIGVVFYFTFAKGHFERNKLR
ncbi:MAG: MFS transporter [Paludibacteraceae bacterium]|nr:MFS transporter [Paludibacteraceae bacterium]